MCDSVAHEFVLRSDLFFDNARVMMWWGAWRQKGRCELGVRREVVVMKVLVLR